MRPAFDPGASRALRNSTAPSSTSSCSVIRTAARLRPAASSKFSAAPANSASTPRSSFASIISHTHSPPKFSTRPSAARSPSANRSAPAAKTSATCPSSPSTEKPRAISTTPSTSSIAPTAAGTCKSTSPTWRTMFELARRSTRKRDCAALPFTSPIGLFLCSPKPCQTACVRSSPTKIAW